MFEYRSTHLLFRAFKLHRPNIKLISTASNVCNGSIHLTNYSLRTLINIPSRNTFIVKRMLPVRLYKEENKPRLEKLHYVYDIVENTDFKKEPVIDVVLTSYVQGVGNDGDIVSMKLMDAYNRILMPGLGDYSTTENLEYSKRMKKDEVVQEKQLSPSVEFVVEYLKKRCVLIVMNKETEWTIEPWHIRSSFRKSGIHVYSDSQIKLPPHPIKGPNMDLQDKHFYVNITINGKHNVKVQCRIHHWATSPQDRLPLHPQYWSTPPEFIFPEDNPNRAVEPKSSDAS